MAHQLYEIPGIRKMIHRTMLALIEKMYPIRKPVTPQHITQITPITMDAIRHQRYFFESIKIAKGPSNNKPNAIQDFIYHPPIIEHIPIWKIKVFIISSVSFASIIASLIVRFMFSPKMAHQNFLNYIIKQQQSQGKPSKHIDFREFYDIIYSANC